MRDLLYVLFPLLVLLGALVVFVAALRLDRRMSRGAHSAGPADVPRPAPAGQAALPWELQAIEDQLRLSATPTSSTVPRHDLSATVNRLMRAAGFNLPHEQIPPGASPERLAQAIAKIEHRLGLPPLEEGP